MNKFEPTLKRTPEAEPGLEEVGDEEVVGVHLDPVPAGVRDHDGGDRRRPG